MKAILICPDARPPLAKLAAVAPLVTWPILGKSLVEYWLEHLVALGAKEVCLLAADRPDQVRSHVGDGARWGLSLEVMSETLELTVSEARRKYRQRSNEQWLPQPNDVISIDCLPGFTEQPLFESGADWFKAVFALLSGIHEPASLVPSPAGAEDRSGDVASLPVGMRQIEPGIWAGLRTRIARTAKLHPPCWLGHHVWIGGKAVIGPMAVVEDRAFVEAGATISHSIIKPETFVGHLTRLEGSLAWGNILVDWRTGSSIEVAEPFLLCALHQRHPLSEPSNWLRRLAALKLVTAAPSPASCEDAAESPMGASQGQLLKVNEP